MFLFNIDIPCTILHTIKCFLGPMFLKRKPPPDWCRTQLPLPDKKVKFLKMMATKSISVKLMMTKQMLAWSITSVLCGDACLSVASVTVARRQTVLEFQLYPSVKTLLKRKAKNNLTEVFCLMAKMLSLLSCQFR